jgi:formyl-CoA transferase
MPPEETGVPPGSGPLAALRVLELASLFAAPLMGAMLGDLGADVVKVEPPGGDELRVLGASQGRPGPWTLASRNKRMITLDAATVEGRNLLHRLTTVADVVTLNHPRGLLERLGCTYEEIAARNPRAVVVNTSAFGPTGPYADRPGNGSIAEAFAGLTHLVRDGDDRPMLTPILFGDHLTALAGVIGTLAACYWRDARGGRGQYVDLTMYEAVLAVLGPYLLDVTGPPRPEDQGGASRSRPGLRGTFPTADDSWVVATAYSDAQVGRLLDAVGVAVDTHAARGEPADPARLAADWISTQDRDHVVAAMRAARIQVTPVNDGASLAADPQVQHRGSLVQIDRGEAGPLTFARPSPLLTESAGSIRSADRPLGGDQDTVLRDWLGEVSAS